MTNECQMNVQDLCAGPAMTVPLIPFRGPLFLPLSVRRTLCLCLFTPLPLLILILFWFIGLNLVLDVNIVNNSQTKISKVGF